MSGAELPVYLVALRDRWAVFPSRKEDKAAPAFGTVELARKYVRRIARRMELPEAAFRIVEYAFSGKVLEG